MATFDLYEDVKVTNWRRSYFKVEAESLQEAVDLIKGGDVDCEYSELLDYENAIDPDFMQVGDATYEIYDTNNDSKPLYTNEFQVQ